MSVNQPTQTRSGPNDGPAAKAHKGDNKPKKHGHKDKPHKPKHHKGKHHNGKHHKGKHR